MISEGDHLFWDKVRKKENGCWIWLAGCGSPRHFGYFTYNGRTVSASRLAWESKNGKLDIKKRLRHSCQNAKCVNPDHMFVIDRGARK